MNMDTITLHDGIDNMDAITLQDCIDSSEKLGRSAIIKAGHVIGFVKEKELPELAFQKAQA